MEVFTANRELIVEFVKAKAKKRKTEMEGERCYGCGKTEHFIANCFAVICFCCDGEGHWTAKMAMPLVRWASTKKPRTEVRRPSVTVGADDGSAVRARKKQDDHSEGQCLW